jgi:adenylyl cyclase-associated protein
VLQVTLDGCKKVAIVLDSAISGVDVVNSQSCQVQILGKAPTVLVDKTDGLQLYLSKDGLDTEILSAKSSELNVTSPGPTDNDDPIETSLPEQLKTSWNGKKFVTTILEHKG